MNSFVLKEKKTSSSPDWGMKNHSYGWRRHLIRWLLFLNPVRRCWIPKHGNFAAYLPPSLSYNCKSHWHYKDLWKDLSFFNNDFLFLLSFKSVYVSPMTSFQPPYKLSFEGNDYQWMKSKHAQLVVSPKTQEAHKLLR